MSRTMTSALLSPPEKRKMSKVLIYSFSANADVLKSIITIGNEMKWNKSCAAKIRPFGIFKSLWQFLGTAYLVFGNI